MYMFPTFHNRYRLGIRHIPLAFLLTILKVIS